MLQGSSWQERLYLLPFSLHLNRFPATLPTPTQLAAYRDLLNHYGLLPEQILAHPRPTVFADIVASGGSFYSLIILLKRFADENHTDWNAVRKKIRLIGIRSRQKTSPKTWRWQQHSPWLTELLDGTRSVTNVSVSAQFYHYLADHQPKTTSSYPPKSWGSPVDSSPESRQRRLPALRLARFLYEAGTTRECRADFAVALRQQPAMREPWLR